MKTIEEILSDNSGIQLDICCGSNKQQGFIGIDIQDLPEVDLIWDINIHPWPLPDECVIRAIASHVIEHIPTVMIDGGRTRFPFIEFMDEVWRITKPEGEFAIACPHGSSAWFLQDPTHCNPINEATWMYFDPNHPLYSFYRPKPWHVKFINWNPAANIEVVLIKEALNGQPA